MSIFVCLYVQMYEYTCIYICCCVFHLLPVYVLSSWGTNDQERFSVCEQTWPLKFFSFVHFSDQNRRLQNSKVFSHNTELITGKTKFSSIIVLLQQNLIILSLMWTWRTKYSSCCQYKFLLFKSFLTQDLIIINWTGYVKEVIFKHQPVIYSWEHVIFSECFFPTTTDRSMCRAPCYSWWKNWIKRSDHYTFLLYCW